MSDHEPSYLSYIDLLSSALGASILLMIVLGMLVQESGPSIATETSPGTWVEAMIRGEPTAYQIVLASASNPQPRVDQRQRPGERGVEMSLPDSDLPQSLELRLAATGAGRRLAELLRSTDYALLRDPAAYGARQSDPPVAEFLQLIARTDAADPVLALPVLERWFQHVDGLRDVVELDPVLVRRAHRLRVALQADGLAAGGPAEVTVRMEADGLPPLKSTLLVDPDGERVRLRRSRPGEPWVIDKRALP
jgi:hypothetical protein